MKTYIAGPMTGYENQNFPAFHAKAAEQRALGYEVVNPAEINGEDNELAAIAAMTPEELLEHYRKCMANDITELLTCKRIVMLDGWTRSKGASLEHHIAKVMGFEVVEVAS